MSIDNKIANHTCNVIRRLLDPVISDLTMLFIVHGEHERQKQFAKQTHFIQEHPCGDQVMRYFQANPEILKANRSMFCGLAKTKTPGFFGFLKSDASLAVCFLNYDRFSSEEYFKNHVLHLTWHAYALYSDLKNEDVALYEYSNPKNKNSLILPSLDKNELQHRNLMADIFSASIQNLQGKKVAPSTLAAQRLESTLNKVDGYIAENFPFIIALETLEHALESYNHEKDRKKGNTALRSIEITKTTGKTFSIQSAAQWSGFSYPAQHMAWCNFDPETVLGAAIYTNENTYVRSIADIVAERMNIKPKMISNFGDFNPFTEFEVNQRTHKKNTDSQFDTLIRKIQAPRDCMVLLEEARLQNEKILTGNPVGWCAHSIISVVKALQANDTEEFDDALTERMLELFQEEQMTLDFQIINNFAKKCFEIRRTGETMPLDNIENIKDRHPEFSSICNSVIYIRDLNDDIDSALKEQKKGISSFTNTHNLKG